MVVLNGSSSLKPLSIAVIGGGPSGLFFCHAIEKMLQQSQNSHPRKVKVTCFERSSQPGGIWKSADKTKTATSSNTEMYDALWTNGSSHCTEFHDYSFDEHFGKPVSVYMKRQDLLDYILGRVTKHCPNFFNKYVEFEKSVKHVKYDNDDEQFAITIQNMDETTSTEETRYFDKCIWACGENGVQSIPKTLTENVFRNFKGNVIHSADSSQFEQYVKNKRILLIGGGFSAEDLALQAIKVGVSKVYVVTRSLTCEVTWTKHWLQDKVEVHIGQVPVAVTGDNNKSIQFKKVNWTPGGYESYDEDELDDDYVPTTVHDIDTIILCTGYKVNLDMLDNDLRMGFPKSEYKAGEYLSLPQDWKMKHGLLSDATGDVTPSEKLRYLTYVVHPELYRGVLISNPNMMFVSSYGSYTPLLACDVYSWLLAGFCLGEKKLPSTQEMKESNTKEALAMMHNPYFRYLMDDNYWRKVDYLEGFWPDDYPDTKCELWEEVEYEEYIISMKRIAGVMREGNYPFNLGTYEELNEAGTAMLDFGEYDYYNREKLTFKNEEEKKWKTFRDVEDTSMYYSLQTGTKAVPLAKHWLDETTGTTTPTA